MKEIQISHFDEELLNQLEELTGDLILSSWQDENSWTALIDDDSHQEFVLRLQEYFDPVPAYSIKNSDADQIDWLMLDQQQLPPTTIGPFLLTLPHHDLGSIPLDNLLPIHLNTPYAFGSGHHFTTTSCLEMLLTTDPTKIKTVLDLGCGSGILAIAAKKQIPTTEVWAVDIDLDAVHSAKENCASNNVQVKVLSTEDFTSKNLDHYFDLIFANIHLNVLLSLAKEITSLAKEGCVLILSGYLVDQADELKATYRNLGWEVVDEKSDETWVSTKLIY